MNRHPRSLLLLALAIFFAVPSFAAAQDSAVQCLSQAQAIMLEGMAGFRFPQVLTVDELHLLVSDMAKHDMTLPFEPDAAVAFENTIGDAHIIFLNKGCATYRVTTNVKTLQKALGGAPT